MDRLRPLFFVYYTETARKRQAPNPTFAFFFAVPSLPTYLLFTPLLIHYSLFTIPYFTLLSINAKIKLSGKPFRTAHTGTLLHVCYQEYEPAGKPSRQQAQRCLPKAVPQTNPQGRYPHG